MNEENTSLQKRKEGMGNSIDFIKYQACGNTFIVTEAKKEEVTKFKDSPSIIRTLLDDNFGIGADGVLFLEDSDFADAKMRLFDKIENQKVYEAFMSGNAIRSAADYLHSILEKDKLKIETRDGVKEIIKIDEKYRVDMGKVRWRFEDLVKFLDLNYFSEEFSRDERMLQEKVHFPEIGEIKISIVNSGDPHAVIFLEETNASSIEDVDLDRYGRALSKNSPKFPIAMNTDICEVVDDNTIKARTFEAGVLRETLSCGTGATACAMVSYLTDKIKDKSIDVLHPGGKLKVEITEDTVFLIGPANPIFTGRVNLEDLKLI